jgi:hypothetical protein
MHGVFTMPRIIRPLFATTLLTATIGLAGCGGESSLTAGGGDSATSATAGPDILLASLPEDALGIEAAKPTLEAGQTVALRGRIGGNRAPMTGDSGVFLMMDLAAKACPPDEGCPTPWDYCCLPAAAKSAVNATVQLVDAAGTPLTADFAALGLEPLDEVVVVGTVGPRPDSKVLVIRATGVHKVAGG